jgi:hypothetical protein
LPYFEKKVVISDSVAVNERFPTKISLASGSFLSLVNSAFSFLGSALASSFSSSPSLSSSSSGFPFSSLSSSSLSSFSPSFGSFSTLFPATAFASSSLTSSSSSLPDSLSSISASSSLPFWAALSSDFFSSFETFFYGY